MEDDDYYPGEVDLLDFEHSVMFNITDRAAARRFVATVLPHMTIRDLKEAAALMYGISGKKLQVRRARRRVGGSSNFEFCSMLAALDSVHDFRDGDLPVDSILAYAGLNVGDFDVALQAAMTTGLSDFESNLVGTVAEPTHFTFKGRRIPNLLRGCDLARSSVFEKAWQMNV